MKCDELIQYWDEYVTLSVRGGHDAALAGPRFPLLRQLWSAYSGGGQQAAEGDMIVEPYLGDLRHGNRQHLKLIMLNLNPGPSRAAHQRLAEDSTFGKQLSQQLYSEWAATWPYLSQVICEQWGGPFVRQRIRFAEELVGTSIQAHEVLAFEMFPWHSSRWGDLRGPQALPALRELVLDPLGECVKASGALLLAFGKPWQHFAESIGTLAIQHDLSISERTGRYKRRFLQYRLPTDLRLNLIINAGYAGPPRPGHPDSAIIRNLVRGTN